MPVLGLGHFGYYVKDLELMKEFWGNFMGMTLTKCSDNAAFFSATLPGRDRPLGTPGGASAFGPVGVDTPLVAALVPRDT